MAKQASLWQKVALRSKLSMLALAFGANSLARSVLETGLEFEKMERVMAFATGSAVEATMAIDDLREVSTNLGLNFLETAQAFARFNGVAKSTAIAGEQARESFMGIATAGAALGLSIADQRGIFRALEQMLSKATVQAEELRGQLGERLPGALPYAAEALGVTSKELNKMLQRGEVLAVDLLPKLSKVLMRELGPSALLAAEQTQAAVSRMSSAWDDLKNKIFDSSIAITTFNALTKGMNKINGSMQNTIPTVDVLQKKLDKLNKVQTLSIKKTEHKSVINKQLEMLKVDVLNYKKELSKLEKFKKAREDNVFSFLGYSSVGGDGKEKQFKEKIKMLEKQRGLLIELQKKQLELKDIVNENTRKMNEKVAFSNALDMLDKKNSSEFDKKQNALENWFNSFKTQLKMADTKSAEYLQALKEATDLYSKEKGKLIQQAERRSEKRQSKEWDNSEFEATTEGLGEVWRKYQEGVKSGIEVTNKQIVDGMDKTVASLTEGVKAFVQNGKQGFKDWARSAMADIASVALKKLAFQAMTGTMGLFASGGVISGGVQKFAKGGVISSPTTFPMRNGTGLMGEAGPEAIMPITRIGGDLGVKADLSGLSGNNQITINQNISIDARNSKVSEGELRQAAEDGAKGGFDLVMNDLMRGGVLTQI
jgi:tape measure domain-containing protein